MHYLQWVDHLVHNLRPTGNKPGTWYIRPSDELIGPTEAEQLFHTIRTWWLSELRQPYTARSLRQRLLELRPNQELPILYAMSYVARNWGTGAEFWPPFCEHVLGNWVELEVIHVVASDLTNLWKNVHRYSNGTLYYPPEGRSNIKWPLTHAGLLSDEEQYLERFGRDLIAEWDIDQPEPHPLLLAEVDDFQTALLDWLREERLGLRPFAKRLVSEYTGLTVALMAQSHLRQIWHQLQQQLPCEPIGVRPRYRHIRPRLRYDAELNRLTLMLSDAQWPGRLGTIRVEHDGRNEIWATYYVAATNTTYSRSVEIPLPHPRWGTMITLKFGREPVTLTLLASPFTDDRGAMLFDSLTGNRTRTMKPGESYYLALPQPMANAQWREELFPEASSLGNPFRSRGGYDLLLVTACGRETLLDPDRLDHLNDELIKAGASFRLPTLDDLTRVQFRLVGGLPLPDRTNSAPLFHVDHPPLLEVSGAFPMGLSIGLERLVPGSRTEIVASVHLAPARSVSRAVIALFGDGDLVPGQYRVSAGSDWTEFRIGNEPFSPTDPYRLELAFHPEMQPATGTDFGYHLLQDGRFSGTAWPGAVLTVVVKRSRNEIDRFYRQLFAERDSSFAFELTDFYSGILPPAPLEVAVEDRVLRSASIAFAQQAYFRRWSTHWSDQGLHLSGHVIQVPHGTPVTAIAFGEAPWKGQIWHSKGCVGTHGEVNLTFKVRPGYVRYVAVAEGMGECPSSVPWLATRVQHVPARNGPWNLDGDATWTTWVPWMEVIAAYAGADREIQQLAAFSRVRRYLADRFSAATSPQSGWCRPGTLLRADLPLLLRFEAAPRVALVQAASPLPAAPTYAGQPIGPTPGFPVLPDIILPLLQGIDPGGGWPICVTEGIWQAKSTLWSAGAPTYAILEAGDSLMICHDCGRILPRYGAEYHTRPTTYEHNMCHSFTQIFPETRISLTLVMECLPRRLASCIAELFAYASRNKALPPEANAGLLEWFKQVAQHYPRVSGAPTPTRWGSDVATAAGDLVMLILYPHLPVDPDRLAPVVAVYDQYSEAVLSVMERLLAWVKESDE